MSLTNDDLDIWFIRHGQTDWNREGRIQGASGTDLSYLGRRQAEALRERLREVTFDQVWSSDLARARQTAEVALPGAIITLDARLREMHAGEHEGQLMAELSPAARAVRDSFTAGDSTVAPPGGESYRQVIERLRSWMGDLPSGRRVACVTHGGVVEAAVRLVLGQEAGWQAGPRVSIANTSITEVRLGSRGYSLMRLNDHAHLERLASDAAEARVEYVADSVAQ